MQNPSLFLIEPDQKIRSMIVKHLNQGGYEVAVADNYRRASGRITLDHCLIVLSEAIPGESCIETVRAIRRDHPHASIYVLTDGTTRLSTIELISDQIAKYQSKPLNMQLLAENIALVLHEPEMGGASRPPVEIRGVPALPAPAIPKIGRAPAPEVIGDAPMIRRVRELAAEVADTDMTVLIRGESGVGKGVVARMIHHDSQRYRDNNLVTINCPAIPESLMESELFGHESGAFTGASNTKPGRIEMAHGGTAFLDEIAEIPTTMQVKLLEVIERKELYHLGGKHPIRVDARFLAATNANLEQLMAAGQFRPDLFYRINEFTINLPPLRDHMEDLPLLVDYFLHLYSRKLGVEKPAFSNDVLAAMMHYNWPGNVRELEMIVHRFVLNGSAESVLASINHDGGQAAQPRDSRHSLLHKKEVQMVLSILLQSHWNQRQAAKVLGISYSALRRRIEKYGLKKHSTYNVNTNDDGDSLELRISARL
ncbi:sigma-54 dependent transcriptional regulator [bacterium]|nr:sigma-54 dependent transcriptional regulator [bacterium]